MVIVIALVAFIEGASTAMLRPFIAPYAVSLGASAIVAGLAVALSQVPGFILAVPLGAVADSWGARRVLRAGILALSTGAAVLAVTHTILGLLVSQLVIGLGTVGVGIALQATATRPVGDANHDPRRVTAFATFILVGNLVGPVLAGVLVDLRGYYAAFSGVALLGVLSIVVASFLPHDPEGARRPSSRGSDHLLALWSPYRGAGVLFRERAVGFVVVASGLAVTTSHLGSSFLPLYFESLGWSASRIGVVLSVAAAAGIVSRALHPVLDRSLPAPLYIGGTLVLGGLGITAAVLTASFPVVAGVMAVSGFMLGAANPITLTMLARVVAAERRGLSVGLRLAANRFGTAAGPIAFGAMASVGGVRLTLGLLSAFSAATGGMISRGFQRRIQLEIR